MDTCVSGSGSDLSSSPSSRSAVDGPGSDVFKSVLRDYIYNETRTSQLEMERYKFRQKNKNNDIDAHSRSSRCESCQCVLAFCKCDLYRGRERKFGHRVHWADEVWERPLTTSFSDSHLDSDEDDEQAERHEQQHYLELVERACSHSSPKPILKHRATCIVIVSE